MVILNPRAQIALVLAQTFFNLLRNNADLMKLVMRVGSVSGKNKYRRK